MPTSVAIVTGASQGIGRATAIRLAKDFSSIVLAARDLANLEVTAASVKAAGAEPLVVDLDLSKPAAASSSRITRGTSVKMDSSRTQRSSSP